MEYGLCVEMALATLPFADRLRRARALGFCNVEMWFVDKSYQGSPEMLAEMAEKLGLRITNTVIGAPDGSIGGGLTNPAHRSQWLARAQMTLDFTRRANIPATIVCTGNTVPAHEENELCNNDRVISTRLCLFNHNRHRALSMTCNPTPRPKFRAYFIRTYVYICTITALCTYNYTCKVFHVEHMRTI